MLDNLYSGVNLPPWLRLRFLAMEELKKSLALLIWLNENVGFVLSAKSIIICEKQLISGIKCVIDDTFKFLLARLPCGYSHLIEPLSLKNAFLMGCAYG